MIRSMTGFARREMRGEWGALAWELRSVNHRYLDVSLRLPEQFRALEGELRETITASLGRGKVDAGLRFEPGVASGQRLTVNQERARQLAAAAAQLQAILPAGLPPGTADLLRWPGVIQEEPPDLEPVQEHARRLLTEALDELTAARAREGERVARMLEARCTAVIGIVAAVRAQIPDIRDRLREKLLARLAELDVQPDNNRLEQELVFGAQRLDVAEELDRLDSHVAELHAALERDEPVGRRLDFLMQEFNREANTLGSKSQDAETTRAAVDLKVLIEQMREQIQNIE